MHNNEAYALLDEILSRYGTSEFGRINQIMLGFSFIGAGYKVPTMQLTGRPDIVAKNKELTYDVEVKTSCSSSIPLKKEDLTGVNGHGSVALIAVLSYPDVPLRWLMTDAKKLRPRVYPKTALAVHSITDLEEILTNQFLSELEKYRLYALQGTGILLQVFRDEQSKGV